MRRRTVYHVPDGDVEDVAADWTGHGHVAEPFLGDDHTRNEVRNASSRR